MYVWREAASKGSETIETRECHVHFCLGLLGERLSFGDGFRNPTSFQFYVVAELVLPP